MRGSPKSGKTVALLLLALAAPVGIAASAYAAMQGDGPGEAGSGLLEAGTVSRFQAEDRGLDAQPQCEGSQPREGQLVTSFWAGYLTDREGLADWLATATGEAPAAIEPGLAAVCWYADVGPAESSYVVVARDVRQGTVHFSRTFSRPPVVFAPLPPFAENLGREFIGQADRAYPQFEGVTVRD